MIACKALSTRSPLEKHSAKLFFFLILYYLNPNGIYAKLLYGLPCSVLSLLLVAELIICITDSVPSPFIPESQEMVNLSLLSEPGEVSTMSKIQPQASHLVMPFYQVPMCQL